MTEVRTGSVVNYIPPASQLAYSVCVAALLAFGLYVAFVSAPAMRANAQATLDHAIADENLAFCEKFGMQAGTSQFVSCTQELAVIRQKQTDRDDAAAVGIL